MLRYEVNLKVTVTFGVRLTWVITHWTRLESAPSHPGHPGGDDLLLESAGFSLFVLIDLTLESLDPACPFSETDRVRLGYIECPSTSCSVHEEKGWEVVRVVADGGRRQISHNSRTKRLSATNHFRQSKAHSPLLIYGASLHRAMCSCSLAPRLLCALPRPARLRAADLIMRVIQN